MKEGNVVRYWMVHDKTLRDSVLLWTAHQTKYESITKYLERKGIDWEYWQENKDLTCSVVELRLL